MTPTTPSPISDQAAGEPLRNAVFAVLEGWNIPAGARKILETAYYTNDEVSVSENYWFQSYAINPMINSSAQGALLHRLNDATKPVDAADRNLITRALTTPPSISLTDRDATFLSWLADRLVHVYGEPENVDFVLALRRISTAPTTGSAPTVYLRQSSEFGPWLETGKDEPFAVAFVAASPAVSAPVFVLPFTVATIIDGAFLPTNPNRMRNAHPDVVAAVKIFKESLSAAIERRALLAASMGGEPK